MTSGSNRPSKGGVMRTFRMVADCEFVAEGIDDALLRLSRHFLNEGIDGVRDELLHGGEISIHPVDIKE